MEAEAVPAARPRASRPHLRRIAFPLGLALTRLLRRGGPSLLAGIGVAAAAAALAAVGAGSLTAEDAALRHGVRAIAPADRTLRVNWLGVPGPDASFGALDSRARGALRGFGQPAFSSVVFRETRVGGALADLAASEQLGRFVRLTSGRLPRSCTPARCEVVQLAGSGPIPNAPGLRLAVVGRGALVSTVPFGSLVARTVGPETVKHALAWHRPAQPPLLVAGDPAGLAAAAPLAPIYRSYAWVAPLPPVHPWTVAPLTKQVARTQSALGSTGDLELTAPTDRLAELSTQARAGGRHLLLLGGEVAALLLAFVLVAAGRPSPRRAGDPAPADLARRPPLAARARRARASSPRSRSSARSSAGRSAARSAPGSPLPPAAPRARCSPTRPSARSGSPPGSRSRSRRRSCSPRQCCSRRCRSAVRSARSTRSRSAPPQPQASRSRAEASAQATSPRAAGRRSSWSGCRSSSRCSSAWRPRAPWRPCCARVERRTRGAGVSLRLAALSLARRPGRAALVVVFLVVCVGLGLFAQTYRTTLRAGQADEAAFAVPLDFSVTETGGTLVSPLEAAPLSRYRSLAPGVGAVPVVRQTADVVRLTGSTGLTLLGVPAGTLQQIRRWRPGFASVSPSQLALRLGSVALRPLPRCAAAEGGADTRVAHPSPRRPARAARARPRADRPVLEPRPGRGRSRHADVARPHPGGRARRRARRLRARPRQPREPGRGRSGRARDGRRSSRSRRERRRSAIDFRRWLGVGGGFYGVGGAPIARAARCSTSSRTSRRPGSGRASPPTATRCPRSSRPRSPPRSGRAA